MTGSHLLTLVLLQRTRVDRGELYPLFFLQGSRHPEGSRRTLAEPQKVHGLEIPDRRRRFLCRQTSEVVGPESRTCFVQVTEYVVYLTLLSRSCSRANGRWTTLVMI